MPDEQDNPSPEDQNPQEEPSAESEPQADAAEDPAGDDPEEMNETEASALAAAMQAINQVQGVADSAGSGETGQGQDASPFSAPEFGDAASEGAKNAIDMLSDVHMDVRIELGRTRMYVEDVLKLNDGAVVELDKLAGDPVDVYVNDRRVACGEVLVLNDMFCVRINEVIDITQSDD